MGELLHHDGLGGCRLDRVDVRCGHANDGRGTLANDPHEGNATFSTPTVLHFGVALLVSAILCAPWRSLLGTGTLLGLTGLWGVVYIIHVMCQARRLSVYSPDLEDWIWYTILPLVAYGAIFAGAIVLFVVPEEALFALAGGVVLLTFIGIRNAWDIVTYIVLEGVDKPPNSSGNDESG